MIRAIRLWLTRRCGGASSPRSAVILGRPQVLSAACTVRIRCASVASAAARAARAAAVAFQA
ncbi:hypothetical protein GCM10010472_28680 [Pseudonocardia halophobica]|uniref:Uncharacterized protein n=1 Tax=Pseudonocardia halophobica TaxID=29401 RepID=A0A9W6KXL0_9PSEU|nr:hypothetical protein GCM10017577_02670 [Pseudonocardia halophobica]